MEEEGKSRKAKQASLASFDSAADEHDRILRTNQKKEEKKREKQREPTEYNT